MLTLGEESFIADAVMLGDEEIKGGWMSLKATKIGNRSFVGNSAYIADGTVLPDNVLIGVQSKHQITVKCMMDKLGLVLRRCCYLHVKLLKNILTI